MDIKAIIVNAVAWLLSKLFPPRKPRLNRRDMPEVRDYQYRLSRTVGYQARRGCIEGARVVRVYETGRF